jgi:hypothetical protein
VNEYRGRERIKEKDTERCPIKTGQIPRLAAGAYRALLTLTARVKMGANGDMVGLMMIHEMMSISNLFRG